MENEKTKNNGILNLYDVLKENYEISRKTKAVYNKQKQLSDKLFKYSKKCLSYSIDFAEVESIIGLKKNIEFFFYNFLPFFIQDFLVRYQDGINSLDASKIDIYKYCAFKLNSFEKMAGTIYYCDNETEYFLPASHDNNFNELLIEFINQYHLGLVNVNSEDIKGLKYHIGIDTSLKDLIYACYIGQEWVKYLEDDCIDLLSDYYSEEQLKNYKKSRKL